MDAASLSNLLTPVALGMIALGVGGGRASSALRSLSRPLTRRRARLAGGAVAAGPRDDGRGVAEAFSGVVGGVRRLGDRIAIQDPAQLSAAARQAGAGRLLQPRGRGDLPGRQGRR